MENMLIVIAMIFAAAALVVIGTRLGGRYVDRMLTVPGTTVDPSKPIVISKAFGPPSSSRRPF